MKALLSLRNFIFISSIVIINSSCNKEELQKTDIPAMPVTKAKFVGAINNLGAFGTALDLMHSLKNKPGC